VLSPTVSGGGHSHHHQHHHRHHGNALDQSLSHSRSHSVGHSMMLSNQRGGETSSVHTSQSIVIQHLAMKEDELIELNNRTRQIEHEAREANRKLEMMREQLENTMKMQAKTNQHVVELRMQGMDFKAEVDRRCNKIGEIIESRMGFVPLAVQRQIYHLQALKVSIDDTRTLVRDRPDA
jgi:chromosome segregation ATPase